MKICEKWLIWSAAFNCLTLLCAFLMTDKKMTSYYEPAGKISLQFVFNWSQEVKHNFISSSLQEQAGWGPEQLGLVEGVSAHDSGVGSRWSWNSLSTQTILCPMIYR